MNHSTC